MKKKRLHPKKDYPTLLRAEAKRRGLSAEKLRLDVFPKISKGSWWAKLSYQWKNRGYYQEEIDSIEKYFVDRNQIEKDLKTLKKIVKKDNYREFEQEIGINRINQLLSKIILK